MEEVKGESKKPFDKKGLALGVSIVFVLCIGIAWGYMANQVATPDSCLSFGLPQGNKDSVGTKTDSENNNVVNREITYSTFSIPNAYFTFEYPSAWTYAKEESNPGKESNETFYNFYTKDDKEHKLITLHYPMYETAIDTCLKFEDIANYTLNQFPTNDPGTVVSYLNCHDFGKVPGESRARLGSYISWQKGILKEDTWIEKTDSTEARIFFWPNGLEDSDSQIIDHIAHSIKIIK